MVMDAMRAGALIVAGTDTPNAINLHGEMMAYVLAGMTPYEALKAATVNPAQTLGLDAGTIEPGIGICRQSRHAFESQATSPTWNPSSPKLCLARYFELFIHCQSQNGHLEFRNGHFSDGVQAPLSRDHPWC